LNISSVHVVGDEDNSNTIKQHVQMSSVDRTVLPKADFRILRMKRLPNTVHNLARYGDGTSLNSFITSLSSPAVSDKMFTAESQKTFTKHFVGCSYIS
jgi:hypothetical protein